VGSHELLVWERNAIDSLKRIVVCVSEEADRLVTIGSELNWRTYYEDEFFMMANASILLVSGTSSAVSIINWQGSTAVAGTHGDLGRDRY
jgi:hypothetical protein